MVFTLSCFIPHLLNLRKITFALTNPKENIYSRSASSVNFHINHNGHLSRYGLSISIQTQDETQSIAIDLLRSGETSFLLKPAFTKRTYSTNSGIFCKTSFPFGIYLSQSEIPWQHSQPILPAKLDSTKLSSLKKALADTNISSNDNLEFHSMRKYQSGDSLKHIDWKATIRLNEGISRIYRSQNKPKEIELLFFPGNVGGKDFEAGLELLQAIVDVLINEGFLLSFKSPLLENEMTLKNVPPSKFTDYLTQVELNSENMPMDTLKLRGKFAECLLVSAASYSEWIKYTDFLNEYCITLITPDKVTKPTGQLLQA